MAPEQRNADYDSASSWLELVEEVKRLRKQQVVLERRQRRLCALGLAAAALVGVLRADAQTVAELTTFHAGDPARAEAINSNFATLKGWLEGKVGDVDSAGVTIRDASAPASGDFRGVTVHSGTDLLRVGQRARGTTTNDFDSVVMWGDDTGDVLRFVYEGAKSSPSDVMTLDYQGKLWTKGGVNVSLQCETKSETVPKGDDQQHTLSCNEGYLLTGCSMKSNWHSADGTSVEGETCTGQNGDRDHDATIWMRCCRVS